ncbi:hypothetical protein C8F04DRAFT_1193276 [Mycena alexandri]|uniref:Uncharacterized protein n=1 Tax=Mycena alexandri TaxID=1745969 RepID=A0AAD6S9X8_9AGAR|nr:hypothetical protein C8F04DRAFT_1193276 [Mycena alexandri]
MELSPQVKKKKESGKSSVRLAQGHKLAVEKCRNRDGTPAAECRQRKIVSLRSAGGCQKYIWDGVHPRRSRVQRRELHLTLQVNAVEGEYERRENLRYIKLELDGEGLRERDDEENPSRQSDRSGAENLHARDGFEAKQWLQTMESQRQGDGALEDAKNIWDVWEPMSVATLERPNGTIPGRAKIVKRPSLSLGNARPRRKTRKYPRADVTQCDAAGQNQRTDLAHR